MNEIPLLFTSISPCARFHGSKCCFCARSCLGSSRDQTLAWANMHKPSWHVITQRERVLKVLQRDNYGRARDGTSDMSASRDSTACPPSKLKLVLSCLFNCVISRLRFGWTGALVGETEKPRWPKERLLPSSPHRRSSFGLILGGETKCNNFSGKRSGRSYGHMR